MRGIHLAIGAGVMLAVTSPASAKSVLDLSEPTGGGPLATMPGVLQCVPFARDTSGIRIYGDARTWWSQAAGKYERGRAPRPGAVMAIRPHGGSLLGHVATVSRVVDARTILITHANWSAPGKIERNVTAVDVSPANDWSEVRVWYAPINNLGAAHWPVDGFIYNAKSGTPRLLDKPASTFTRYVPTKMATVRFGQEPTLAANASARNPTSRPRASRPAVPRAVAKLALSGDPIGAIIAGRR